MGSPHKFVQNFSIQHLIKFLRQSPINCPLTTKDLENPNFSKFIDNLPLRKPRYSQIAIQLINRESLKDELTKDDLSELGDWFEGLIQKSYRNYEKERVLLAKELLKQIPGLLLYVGVDKQNEKTSLLMDLTQFSFEEFNQLDVELKTSSNSALFWFGILIHWSSVMSNYSSTPQQKIKKAMCFLCGKIPEAARLISKDPSPLVEKIYGEYNQERKDNFQRSFEELCDFLKEVHETEKVTLTYLTFHQGINAKQHYLHQKLGMYGNFIDKHILSFIVGSDKKYHYRKDQFVIDYVRGFFYNRQCQASKKGMEEPEITIRDANVKGLH
jgi:hypothetical protein